MPYLKSLLAIAFVSAASFLNAQSLASADKSEPRFEGLEINPMNSDDWTFYLDSDSKTYYIDFETISVNLSDVQVYNEKGDLVIKDELWSLPVNTIYELNLGDVEPGKYKIELRTFTGKITREVTLAD